MAVVIILTVFFKTNCSLVSRIKRLFSVTLSVTTKARKNTLFGVNFFSSDLSITEFFPFKVWSHNFNYDDKQTNNNDKEEEKRNVKLFLPFSFASNNIEMFLPEIQQQQQQQQK